MTKSNIFSKNLKVEKKILFIHSFIPLFIGDRSALCSRACPRIQRPTYLCLSSAGINVSLNLASFYTFSYVSVSVCLVYLCVGMYMWVQVPIEATGSISPGAWITFSCEQPGVGVSNQTCIFWKNSKCSYLLSHLSSPDKIFLIQCFQKASDLLLPCLIPLLHLCLCPCHLSLQFLRQVISCSPGSILKLEDFLPQLPKNNLQFSNTGLCS